MRGTFAFRRRLWRGVSEYCEVDRNDVEFCLRHYLFNEPVGQLPCIEAGVAIRYFDEVYPDALAAR